MKTSIYRRIRHRVPTQETARSKNERQQEQTFFNENTHDPFFKNSNGLTAQPVVQLKTSGSVNESVQIHRMEDKKEEDKKVQRKSEVEKDKVQKKEQNPEEPEKEKSGIPTFSERGVVEQNTRHFADCNGVSVEGHTDANYGNSYTSPGTSTPVSDCTDCSAEDCVVNTGTVVSVFTANPQITLPSVPSGLNECEQHAVQQFINTTLRAHELQHVAAFNTYRGTVRTRYSYRGCASGLDAHTQQIHDNIESARKSGSDARSSALDANGANIFNVPCNCPDPKPENGKTND